ncbi:hypothetical protein HYC85_023546 [Camellia sinensis]|uniref:Uncharacterized protein n=1 Tax=Camellia sinensis TaxID=4442 RepID=A0A7J7GFM0_CAMSI|nr:hypothetical protein HYC85_023546 [Camellia sinensis]
MEGLTSDIMVMNEREKRVASLGLASVEVAQGDPFRRVTQSKPFEELREELNRVKASMSGVDQEDLIPCDLIQEETSTLTASALNLLQSRWSDIIEMEGSEEAVVDRFKYIPDSLFLARARNLGSKLDALPMAGRVHSHGVGGGMADSKVYTPIGGRSGSGGRGGRGGRGQNPMALNPELNVVSAVDNTGPDKSWASISDLFCSVFLSIDMIISLYENNLPMRFGVILFSTKFIKMIEMNDGEIPAAPMSNDDVSSLINKLRIESADPTEDAPEMHHVEGAFVETLLSFSARVEIAHSQYFGALQNFCRCDFYARADFLRSSGRGKRGRQEMPLPDNILAQQEGVGQANVAEPAGQQAMSALGREITGALGILRAGNQDQAHVAKAGPFFLKREFFWSNPDEFVGDPKKPLKADEW